MLKHSEQLLDLSIVSAIEEPSDNVFDVVQGVAAEEDRLVMRDVVLLRAHRGDLQRWKVGVTNSSISP